jgi:hypothetical protein
MPDRPPQVPDTPPTSVHATIIAPPEAPPIVLKRLPVPACRELDLMTGRIPDVEADSAGIRNVTTMYS